MSTHETIRTFRLLNGLSRKEIAYKLGISTEYYGKIERGEAVPNADRIKQIAAVFGIEPSSLLAGVPAYLAAAAPATDIEKKLDLLGSQLEQVLDLLNKLPNYDERGGGVTTPEQGSHLSNNTASWKTSRPPGILGYLNCSKSIRSS